MVRGGAVSEDAIGWSRRAVQRVDLRSIRARHKRWEHWALLNDELLFLVTLVDVGPFALQIVACCELATGTWREKVRLLRSLSLPERAHGADIHGAGVSILTRGEHTHLSVRGRLSAEVDIDRTGRDSLNVLVPFNAAANAAPRFAFTSKHPGLPSRGTINGRAFAGLATLDHGRGIWPWRTKWNWASAANDQLAFNLGARWTDHSDTNENGFFLGRTLYPIAEDMRFTFDRRRPDIPVGIVGGDVDLLFTPIARKRARIELGLVAADLDFRVGRFMGRIGGTTVQNLLGWCEAFDARW